MFSGACPPKGAAGPVDKVVFFESKEIIPEKIRKSSEKNKISGKEAKHGVFLKIKLKIYIGDVELGSTVYRIEGSQGENTAFGSAPLAASLYYRHFYKSLLIKVNNRHLLGNNWHTL
jgi:hypothetical protein